MTLRAGSATVDVTPDGPVPMSGYGSRDDRWTGVHDPLRAGALVLDDGATSVGIVSVDLLNVSRPLTTTVERRVAEAGVHLDELVLAATHTHGGPYVPSPVLDIHPTLAVEEDVSGIVDGLAEGIAEAVTTAHGRTEPAELRIGTATDDGTMVNRRLDLGARVPSDALNPEARVLLAEGDSGARTILFNLACHPVCSRPSTTRLTADWPGVTRREVGDALTGDPTVLFLNGAAGDVNPRGRAGNSHDDEFAYMAEIGGEFAETVLAAVEDADASHPHRRGPIVADRRELRLPVKSTPDAETLAAREADLRDTLDRLRDCGHDHAAAAFGSAVTHVRELGAIAEWNAGHLPARLQYVGVGPAGLLSLPGEAFADYALEFAAAADVEHLFSAGYATEYVGYLPTFRSLEHGGYEVWTTKVAPEALAAFRAAGHDLVSGDGSSGPAE